jgi:hypothetical protein
MIISLTAKRATEKKVINGVEFWVTVSPYFLPDRLECGYEKNDGTYRICFRYLDNEQPEEYPVKDELVDVYVGKHTGRVLSVVVHVDKNDIHHIEMLISDRAPKAIKGMHGTFSDLTINRLQVAEALAAHGKELAGIGAGG